MRDNKFYFVLLFCLFLSCSARKEIDKEKSYILSISSDIEAKEHLNNYKSELTKMIKEGREHWLDIGKSIEKARKVKIFQANPKFFDMVLVSTVGNLSSDDLVLKSPLEKVDETKLLKFEFEGIFAGLKSRLFLESYYTGNFKRNLYTISGYDLRIEFKEEAKEAETLALASFHNNLHFLYPLSSLKIYKQLNKDFENKEISFLNQLISFDPVLMSSGDEVLLGISSKIKRNKLMKTKFILPKHSFLGDWNELSLKDPKDSSEDLFFYLLLKDFKKNKSNYLVYAFLLADSKMAFATDKQKEIPEKIKGDFLKEFDLSGLKEYQDDYNSQYCKQFLENKYQTYSPLYFMTLHRVYRLGCKIKEPFFSGYLSDKDLDASSLDDQIYLRSFGEKTPLHFKFFKMPSTRYFGNKDYVSFLLFWELL